MSTGLLVRDFHKQTRQLRFSNSGSIEFSEIEHNAYRLSLTLEITHIDAPRYSSLKTLPENTHWGYCTLFKGSTVTSSIAIKYPKFRVFDIINNGIWAYHQSTEDVATSDSALVLALKYYLTEALPELATGFAPGIISREILQSGPLGELGFDIITKVLEVAGGLGDELPSGDSEYRAFPIASPFPDIAKFKSDIPVSFLWRLEAWYLVNPAVYIADNPSDTGDQTEGEDEYPDPERGDGDGDGGEFPPESPKDPNRPVEDYTGGIAVPFDGKGQCSVAYLVTGIGKVFDLYGEGQDYTGPFSVEVTGPISFVGAKSGIDGFAPSQLLVVVTGLYGDVRPVPDIGLNGGTGYAIENVEIVRIDGLPDTCY